MRILIIESSPAYRREIARLLEARGHVALTENTPAGGIRLARSQRPDLILLRADGSTGDDEADPGNAAAAAESCIAAVAQLKTHPPTALILVLALIDAGPPPCPKPRRFLRRKAARAAAAAAAAGIPAAAAQAAMNASDRMLAAGCDGRIVFPSEPGVFLAKVERFLRRVPPPRRPDDLMPITLTPDPLPSLPDIADLLLREREECPSLLPGEECLLMGAAPADDAGDDLLLPLRY